MAPPAYDNPRLTVNGRFYAQRLTGVQRYGREIVLALDSVLDRLDGTGQVVTPPDAAAVPALRALNVIQCGTTRGHVWEQTELPRRARQVLLNLCNTGPAILRRQIVTIHDANIYIRPDSYSRAFRWAYRALLPLLARRAALIATVSKDSARQLAAHLPLSVEDIHVVPNGHEHVLRWNPARAQVASRLSGSRPFILLLGSQARHKNVSFVVDLADELDALGLDLVIAGGRAEIFAKTEQQVRPNARHLGFVTDDDLAYLYTHAFCLAFPSLTEGFGLPILEAMALGCPVVSSDRASMPEVCGTAALLADPLDRAAWIEHFRSLVGSPGLRETLQARGREQARAFSWASSAQKYLELARTVT